MAEERLESRRSDGPENRFARHPAATLAIVLSIGFLACVVAVELLLRTFSGLGHPPLYELSPLFGYRLKANQVIEPKRGLGFLYGARVTTNNLGLRGAGHWDANPERKVLFLGDSVTYGGQYVADAQLFSSVAGRSLPGWQVGNGASNAWGVENIAGLVVDYGFCPARVVVTCVLEADFYRGLTRASSVPLWTETPRAALQDLLMHFVWRANESRYGGSVEPLIDDAAHLDRIAQRAAMRLKQMDGYLRGRGVRHLVFLLPTRSHVVEGDSPDRRVRRLLQRQGIPA
ncbi:MAG: hypothetical protein HY900_23625, partial [Deltaproteobacteria bacterium]|nr:hypothetical protein [Deltaproteobacteria bacterium]